MVTGTGYYFFRLTPYRSTVRYFHQVHYGTGLLAHTTGTLEVILSGYPHHALDYCSTVLPGASARAKGQGLSDFSRWGRNWSVQAVQDSSEHSPGRLKSTKRTGGPWGHGDTLCKTDERCGKPCKPGAEITLQAPKPCGKRCKACACESDTGKSWEVPCQKAVSNSRLGHSIISCYMTLNPKVSLLPLLVLAFGKLKTRQCFVFFWEMNGHYTQGDFT